MTTQTIAPYNGAVLTLGVAGAAVTAAFVFYMLMTAGHAAFNGTSDGVMWGLPVATYVFLAISSTGLTMVAALATVFGLKSFYPIAKRCLWLSIALLVSGFAALALELGHPFRLLWAIPLSGQFASPLVWMGVFYLIALVAIVIKFRHLHRGDWSSAGSRKVGQAAMVGEMLAIVTLGLAFGMMYMRPFWYDGLAPINFLVLAAVGGAGFAVLISYLVHGFSQHAMPDSLRALMTQTMPKLFAAVLVLLLVITAGRTITGLWTNADGAEVFRWTTGSPWFHLALWGGIVLPLYLMLSPTFRSQAGAQLAAASLALLGIAIDRYQYVIGGQIVPLFKGQWAPDLIPYVPSVTEWSVALFALALAAAIYAWGEKALDLSASPQPAS
jgi:molybdopterin-containing oxidoreductase family membrane subunit